uniref:asparagine synthase (glutamine-hydrolyzing) n=1 Tax=Leptocylindrus danicus TaxID=163516 RepID=A0A7S2PCN2_9STRA|mmetsp:Transcript_28322/g.41659  ORF Transcript_28322/g.41659 Transcript_28322/m.41659 type:complete len:586 (+) Transcript_28322:72-1829(+)
MCGILGIFSSSLTSDELRKHLIKCSSELRHRGPDWSGYRIIPSGEDGRALSHGIAHERLAIMDPESGEQPLVSEDGNVLVAVNGEIYNYKEIYADLATEYKPKTGSDCECLLPLYYEHGPKIQMVDSLRGMFSFIIYDKSKDLFMAARDHIGITPLYIGWGNDGSIYIASEMKGLHEHCNRLQQFPPGHMICNKGENANEFMRWYKPDYVMTPIGGPLPTVPYSADALRHAFEKAVVRRMMSDVPWGVLLSGGLDSSLVASICARHMARRSSSFPKLHSFSVGLSDSPDLKAAKKVADFLGTIHHTYTYTLQEGADAVRDVIKSLETYDVTTIRASTPMYLMARKIKAMGIKMVLSGEGADEVFGGYLYFHKAPNAREFHEECVDKISRLHMYDCLRCNKAMSAWGVEPRVPFLDADFLEVAMAINPEEKEIKTGKDVSPKDKRIEKWCMRKAFDTPEDPYLPDEILWRQKEQFSDGVGYGWVDSLKDVAAKEVSDQMFANAANRFPYNTPTTKEGYRYRMIFEEFYPGEATAKTVPGGKSIACSTERAMAWDASFATRADPSGRAAGVHDSTYDEGFVADDKVE